MENDWEVRILQYVCTGAPFFETLDKALSSFGEMPISSEQYYGKSSSYNFDSKDYVVTKNGIVGAYGRLLLESKLIHGGCRVAYIEDICVNPDYRGQGLARLLIDKMIDFALYDGSYKIILSCSPELQELYEKLGFSKTNNIQMEVRNAV